MLKNRLIPGILVMLLFVTVVSSAFPVYAQNSDSNNDGFFAGIGRLVVRLLSGNNTTSNSAGPRGTESGETQNRIRPFPAGSFKPMPIGRPSEMISEGTPGGQLDVARMEEMRLNLLVKSGKITEAQKTAIIAKLKSVHDELTAWASSQGIDPVLVLPGPGLGMKIGPGPEMGNMTRPGTPSAKMKPSQENGGGYGGHPDRGQNMMMPQVQQPY